MLKLTTALALAVMGGSMLAANTVMGLFLWLVAGDWRHWLEWGSWERIGEMTLLCVGGLVLYLLTLFVCGARLRQFQGQE